MPNSPEGDVIVSGNNVEITDLEDGDEISSAGSTERSGDSVILPDYPSYEDVSEREYAPYSPILTKIKKRTVITKYSHDTNFMKLVWKGFLTLQLFILPVLLRLMFAMFLEDKIGMIFGDDHKEAVKTIVAVVLGIAMAAGMAWHLTVLEDMEDAIRRVRRRGRKTWKKVTTTTHYYNDGTEEEDWEEQY